MSSSEQQPEAVEEVLSAAPEIKQGEETNTKEEETPTNTSTNDEPTSKQTTTAAAPPANANRTTLSTEDAPLAGSRLPEIWREHLDQYRKLDALEKKIDNHAARIRRRVLCLLDQTPTHRQSHLRLFVSHQEQEIEKSVVAGPGVAKMQIQKQWHLVLEGTLLIGHLDHESAANFDAALQEKFQEKYKLPKDHSSLPWATSQQTNPSALPVEEEAMPDPMKFTHFFDKLVAQFQTLYQPKNSTAGTPSTPKPAPKKAPASSSKKKSARSTKRQKTEAAAAAAAQEEDVSEANDLEYSEPTELVWNKTRTVMNAQQGKVTTTMTSEDAHAFSLEYTSPPPPSADQQIWGVIATVQLYAARGPHQGYKPTEKFAKIFFPKHLSHTQPPMLPTTSIAEAAKQDAEAAATPSKSKSTIVEKKRPAHTLGPHALENEIHTPPASLTMSEILQSVFTYIQDNQLMSESDPTLIENDTKLKELFGCDSMRFTELPTLLTQQKLVLLLPKPAPIVLKYVMKPKVVAPTSTAAGASATGEQAPANAATPEEEDDDVAAPMTMDLHHDIYVPNVFPARARELMRRIKRRELDYTSTRTKGRHLLLSQKVSDENMARVKLEEAIAGPRCGDWQALTALAKAAPPHSEARETLYRDAKIAYLVDQVESAQVAANQAWQLVDMLRNIDDDEDENDANDNKQTEEEKKPAATSQTQGDPMDIDTTPAAQKPEEVEATQI